MACRCMSRPMLGSDAWFLLSLLCQWLRKRALDIVNVCESVSWFCIHLASLPYSISLKPVSRGWWHWWTKAPLPWCMLIVFLSQARWFLVWRIVNSHHTHTQAINRSNPPPPSLSLLDRQQQLPRGQQWQHQQVKCLVVRCNSTNTTTTHTFTTFHMSGKSGNMVRLNMYW